jgi:hypothetical protein
MGCPLTCGFYLIHIVRSSLRFNSSLSKENWLPGLDFSRNVFHVEAGRRRQESRENHPDEETVMSFRKIVPVKQHEPKRHVKPAPKKKSVTKARPRPVAR